MPAFLHNFAHENGLINQFVAELRNAETQNDRLRFRHNLSRIGSLLAYEISRKMAYHVESIETPLGTAETPTLAEQPVLATILRAGLPMHEGMLLMFDNAANAFVSAYRRHHKDGSFEIQVEYISTPSLENRILIVCDPMIATGSSMEIAVRELIKQGGQPAQVHIACIIASADGIVHLHKNLPFAHIWTCAIDDELTAKSYIVPGLGDAGDLAYGEKNID